MIRCILSILFSLILMQTCHADNWPQWRGADLQSSSNDTSLPAELDKEKNLLWRVAMPGAAGASPVVWGDNAFVTSTDGDKLLLMCVGVKDGKVKWKKALQGSNKEGRDHSNSASPSPCTDGTHVWAMMSNGILTCFTVQGEKVWQKDLSLIHI